eukprot:1631992-Amphidinium_carterae.1
MDKEEALETVTDMLLQFQQQKKIVTADFLVSLCFHMSILGATGLEGLSMQPSSCGGGNAQKKIDRRLDNAQHFLPPFVWWLEANKDRREKKTQVALPMASFDRAL